MYYPLKKQIKKVYKINTDVNALKIFKSFMSQVFIVFFKIILLIVLIAFSISLIKFVEIEFMYSKLSCDEIVHKANQSLDVINNLIYELSSLEDIGGDIGNSISNSIDELGDIGSSVNGAIGILLGAPTEPITSETLSDYLLAATTFYGLSIALTSLAASLGGLPFGVDFEVAVEGLAEEMFLLGNMVLQHYSEVILPIVTKTNSVWSSLVAPLTSIINALLILLGSFVGVAFMMPILIGNEGTPMGLPQYFWLIFAVSLVLMVVFAILNLVKIASNSDQSERNKTIKNFSFGFLLTITSFIVVPIIFGSVVIFFSILIESLFSVSLLSGSSIDYSSISMMITSNSTTNGAIFLGSLKHPYGYLDGEIILLTKTYFDYTLFSIFSIITVICLFVLAALVLINTFSILQYLVIGPVVLLMYMKDGIIIFSNWFRNLIKLFFSFTIIVFQVLLLIELANVFNTSLNDVIAYSSIALMTLFGLLLVGSVASIFVFSKMISSIFFKDYRVKAEFNRRELDGVRVDANVKNKNLNVSDDNLTRSIKTNMNKVQRNSTKNLKRVSKRLDEIKKSNIERKN